jgi:hypothetical protein
MAIAKAWTTIAAQRSSRLQYERLSSRPGLLPALSDLSDGRFLAVPGGILLRTEEGHVGFNLSASRSAVAERYQAVKNREVIAEKMTPAQIAEAQRLAAQWKPN